MSGWLPIIQIAATTVIAIYVASIGTFQWRTAREKLRLDLYNRRFDVYVNSIAFMQTLMEWVSATTEDRRAKRVAFIRSVRESRFLFADAPEILALLEEMNKRSFVVSGFVENFANKGTAVTFGPDYVSLYNDKQADLEWIMEATERLETMLVPYLAFRHRESSGWSLLRFRRHGKTKRIAPRPSP